MTQILFPDTLEQAVALLAEHDGARPVAGGATLVAMRNAGLVDSTHLVSLDRIPGLRGIERLADGRVSVGAMTRHADTAMSGLFAGSLEVVRKAAGMIANKVVRNMGTMGGSVANADPAADYLPALACTDAVLSVLGPDGARDLPILDYVQDWYETALGPAEIIAAITFPAAHDGPSTYRKIARVSGDFATASCAMALSADGQGVQVAIGACGPGPIRCRDAEAALRGHLDDPQAVATFAAALAAKADPVDDVRGSAGYRLALIPRLVAAVLSELKPVKEAA